MVARTAVQTVGLLGNWRAVKLAHHSAGLTAAPMAGRMAAWMVARLAAKTADMWAEQMAAH